MRLYRQGWVVHFGIWLFVSWSQRVNPRLWRIMLLSWKLLIHNWVTNIQQQFHWINRSSGMVSISAILQARCSMIFWSDTFIRISLKLPPEKPRCNGSWNERQPAKKLHNMHGHNRWYIHVPMIIRIPYICHETFHISHNIQDLNPTYKNYQNMEMIRTLPHNIQCWG